MDLDYILSELGEFGTYQIGVYFLLFFPNAFSAVASLTYVFTAGDLDYRCMVPECETNITSYDKPWLSSALPYTGDKIDSHCKRYKSIDNIFHKNCSDKIFNHKELEECHSFVFKNKENNIIKEFNLLCEENNWKRTLIGTLHCIGEFIGMPLAGIFSDRFGRKAMIITAVLCSSVIGTLQSFSTNYIQFVLCEIAGAIALGGVYAAVYIIGIEFTGPKRRALGGVILSSYYSIGEIILGLIVWLVNDWRTYLRIAYIPGFCFVLYFWIMPESIRWLITHGKKEEVFKSLKRLSAVNKNPMNDYIIEQIESARIEEIDKAEKSLINEKSSNPLKEILKSKVMLLRVLNCSFCWITNAFVYYGLSLSSVVIGGNKYSNFILVSFIEIPGYVITWLVIDAFGRKLPLTAALLISGLACTMFHFIAADMEIVKLILFLIGKCAITVSFASMYMIASEFYPTNIRNSLMSFCSTLGRFGSMTAPQMPLLSAYVDPVLVFGGISFVAGGLALYFPETLHCKLPDNVAEAEIIGKRSSKGNK